MVPIAVYNVPTLSCGVHSGSRLASGSCLAPKLCINSCTIFVKKCAV